MALTRSTITASSRVMLVVYPLFSVWVGFAYIFGDPARTNTPSFAAAKSLMPIPYYGVFFLVAATIQIFAWVSSDRNAMVIGLAVGFGISLGWAIHFAISALSAPGASLTAPAIWGLIAAAHIASLQSITKDKVR